MEPVEPVLKNIYQSNIYTKDLSHISMMSQGFKGSREWRTNRPAYSLLWLEKFHVATRGTSPDVTTVFHTWVDSRFVEIESNLRRKKLYRTNQSSNFLEGSFDNRYNVIPPIQFKREAQPQHLKRWFSLKSRPIHFHINRTIVIRPVKQNQLSFPSIEINKPLFTPVYSVS